MTPTNDDIDFGTHVRVIPGPFYGYDREPHPTLHRNHGTGRITWMSKNVDPAKSIFGVVMDGGRGTSTARLGDLELIGDQQPQESP